MITTNSGLQQHYDNNKYRITAPG